MQSIRETILKQMADLELTIYQVSKMLENKIPQRTIYTFLTGEKDTSTATASLIMEMLGLSIKVENGNTISKKEIFMKTQKPKTFRGRVIAEWEKIGKPDWSPREILGICLLVDFEFRIEGNNPAPIFRNRIESKDYSKAIAWAQGLKFSEWK